MAQLAIKGHATRGKEVIEILKMLSGKNQNSVYSGKDTFHYYFIDNENGYIRTKLYTDDCWTKLTYNIFTLEEFLEKFPYKIGDKVQSKGATSCCTVYVIEHMKWANNYIEYKIRPLYDYYHTGLGTLCVEDLQPYKEETMEENIKEKCDLINFNSHYIFNFADRVELILKDGWEVKNEDGRTYVVKKKSKYPKTYEECCDIFNSTVESLSLETIKNFRHLIYCRNAYWAIAGEQMELGQPWEPDWRNEEDKYCIVVDAGDIRCNYSFIHLQHKLAFPTAEMRDAFYENFKPLIEKCKELL